MRRWIAVASLSLLVLSIMACCMMIPHMREAPSGEHGSHELTDPEPFVTGRRTPAPTATSVPWGEERFEVGHTGRSRDGIVMEIPAFEIRGRSVRVHASFTNMSGRTIETAGRYADGRSARLLVRGRDLQPVAVSDNFAGDICPAHPAGKRGCVWVPGASERGWFEFELPDGGQTPVRFSFRGFDPVELSRDRRLSGGIWKDIPGNPFPAGRWRFDPVLLVGNLNDPSLQMGIRRIEADGSRMIVHLLLRRHGRHGRADGSAGPGEMALLDPAGVQFFPTEFPSDLPVMSPHPGKPVHLLSVAYPVPTAYGPLVFRIRGWPMLRFDPERGVVEKVEWNDGSFRPAPAPPPAPEEIPQREIRQTLNLLADATGRRDLHGVVGLTAPDADLSMDLLGRIVDGGGWPIARVRMRPVAGDFGNDVARDVEVIVEVTLDGMHPGDELLYRARMDFRRAGGEWKVTRWHWDEIPPWTVLRGRSWESDSFLLIGPDSLKEKTAAGVLSELENALEDLKNRFPAELFRPRYVAIYAPDGKTFTGITGRDPEAVLASAHYSTYMVGMNGELVDVWTGDYMIVLNAGMLTGRDRSDPINGLPSVLRHELVHLILAEWTRSWTPGWLREGAAMTYARQPFWRLLGERDLSEDDVRDIVHAVSLHHLAGTRGMDMTRLYAISSAMAEFVRDRWGDDAFLSLYRSYAEVGWERIGHMVKEAGNAADDRIVWDRISRDITPELMMELLGVGPGDFWRDFTEWWKERGR